MIERRRLFLRSDFLRDITRPALLRGLFWSLRLHHRNMDHVCQSNNCHQTMATSRLPTETGLMEIQQLDLVLFATSVS